MATKKIYTREDLTTHGDGFAVCSLCHGRSWETCDDIYPDDHEDDCPLANPEVVGVTVFTMTRARDVICGACQGECVVPDWSLETHEVLRAKCDRYCAAEDI